MRHAETFAAVALLAAALAATYVSAPPSDAREACCPASTVHADGLMQASEPVEPVAPIGPAEAPVKLAVFYEAENPCHEFMVPEARKLAARYEPHVRVEFAPWHAPGTAQLAQQLAVGCLVSVSVTGPVPDESVEPETVTFTGPTEIGAWDWDEVGHAIERRLIEAGVDATPNPVEATEAG